MALLLLLLLLLPLPQRCRPSSEPRGRSCADTRHVLSSRGFSLSLLPPSLISGEHLRICPQDYTCCASETEQRLSRQSQAEFESLVEESGSFLLGAFTARHRKFDDFFRELLHVSEKLLIQMFTQTYGRLYTQNAQLFQELFRELRRYYQGGRGPLEEALADFWGRLLERVFGLLNPQYHFPEEYLECVSKHAERLRPFGDAPRRLRIQVTRALIAARAFMQGLSTGRDILTKAAKIGPSAECLRAVMRMTYCPLCRGMPSLKPCSGFCLNVMKGCLANQADLDTEWNQFLDALVQVAERLEGPFNFELAADSIGVKISEGIMHLQDNSVQISTKVFQGCGNPRPAPGRTRRAARDETKRRYRTYPPDEKPTTAAGTNLDRLVSEVKEKLRLMKGFWVTLPHTLCSDEKVAADVTNEEKCWNGQARGRYLPDVTKDGLVNQINNPEVEVDIARPELRTRQLIMQLRVTTNRLRGAFSGNDVDFQDAYEDGSGGSGGGERYSEDWPSGTSAGSRPDEGRAPRKERPSKGSKQNQSGRSGAGPGRQASSGLLLLGLLFLLLHCRTLPIFVFPSLCAVALIGVPSALIRCAMGLPDDLDPGSTWDRADGRRVLITFWDNELEPKLFSYFPMRVNRLEKATSTLHPPKITQSRPNGDSTPWHDSEEVKMLKELIAWPEPQGTPSVESSTSPENCDYQILNPRAHYSVGETLELLLTARDHQKRPKSYGGDFFQAKLHSPRLKAGVTGSVRDHQNGTYTVTFLLLWPGDVKVSIRLIHSSEAVQIIKRLRDTRPDKIYFYGYFQKNGTTERTECNLQILQRPVCEYIDPKIGERTMTQSTIKGRMPALHILDRNSSRALKEIGLHVQRHSGPLLATDSEGGYLLQYRAHGNPLRMLKYWAADRHYVANDIDAIGGGSDLVIVLNLWAHFVTYPVEPYIRRLQNIRRAVTDLLQRSPQTTVIIKSANTGFNLLHGNDWLSLQLDVILRRMFSGLPVAVIDVWQMTSCHYLKENLHPQRIIIQNEVTRALIAARAFMQGLSTGRDILTKAAKIGPSAECLRAVMRMTYCPLCRGMPSLKPCSGFCLNVMKGCLANQADLDSEWNQFLDALVQVAERLEGPFNFELAVDSIGVKISEGIMHLQDNSVQISTKVFQGCGNPRPAPGRTRRAARDETKRRYRTYPPDEKPTTAAGTNLDRLVSEVKEKLRLMKGFWVTLPHTLCSDEKVAADVTNEEKCWNGQARGRYLPDVTKDGLVNQINNPEVEVDIARPELRTRQLIMQLRVTTNRLRGAFSGNDVDFQDAYEDGSGGSGGGERYSEDWPSGTSAGSRPDEGRAPRKERPSKGSKQNQSGRSGAGPGRQASTGLLLLGLLFLLLHCR
ncbi:LOW QUALITY PROTEIN: glypican-2 [Rhinatrema bivittatum]|uniref:LOW QUALITY PROTEIN: glypican-2 n=1 Tax=Rhinatrema bivittatum TaxID=194408 RepID=UPI00112ED297|nr:LOW QUALITY PROTEIN: glypican-2 [Rhinatrema bivittatum]